MPLKIPVPSICKNANFHYPVKVVNLANEHERLQWREKLGEVLSEKTLYVSEVVTLSKMIYLKNHPLLLQVMNKYEFVPKMPNSSDLELVFDTSFHDVQPHLFKV